MMFREQAVGKARIYLQSCAFDQSGQIIAEAPIGTIDAEVYVLVSSSVPWESSLCGGGRPPRRSTDNEGREGIGAP